MSGEWAGRLLPITALLGSKARLTMSALGWLLPYCPTDWSRMTQAVL
jgi:hypothetical protein